MDTCQPGPRRQRHALGRRLPALLCAMALALPLWAAPEPAPAPAPARLLAPRAGSPRAAARPLPARPPAPRPEPDDLLPAVVAEALQQAQVPLDALAAFVAPVDTDGDRQRPRGLPPRPGATNAGLAASKPRWQLRPDKPMQPASTMKLVTSVVALDRLGPNHRGFTELLTQAPQNGDVLAGDLVLRGGADPELGLMQMWALMSELRWAGLREIAGDIVLDRTLFRFAPGELAPEPFDEKPEFAYNAVPDALQLNNNLLGLELSSEGHGRAGGVVARLLPPLPGVEIDTSGLRVAQRPCSEWADDWHSQPKASEPEPGRLRISLQGSFPKGCTQRTALALIERTALTERHLRWVWEGLGGQWRGRLREATAPLIAPLAPPAVLASRVPANAVQGGSWVTPGVAWAGVPGATPANVRVLARRLSRPWGEVMRMMNKQSDNPSTRLLYLSLGLAGMAEDPVATTAELAARSVAAWFTEHRIAPTGLVVDNGSGLSRSERISPRQMVQMLQAAQAGPWGPELMMSLPIVGVDGTMRNRLKTGPAAGRARLKTGTLKNVVALAGYVPDETGRWWAVSAMVNHDLAVQARPALDALIEWVAAGGMVDGGVARRGR